MSASYLKAAIPEPHRILGQRLKPFSLGHYLILSRFDSPFVSDEPNKVAVSKDDLIFAVLVCAHEYEEFFDFINSPKHQAVIRRWGKAVGPFELVPKINAFWQYFLEGTRLPKFWEEANGTPRPSGTHWSQAILVAITSRVGYTQHQALNQPFAKTVSDYLRFCETEGAVRLMTPEEIAMIEAQEKEAANGA